MKNAISQRYILRRSDTCLGCRMMPDVVLRRNEVQAWVRDTVVTRARDAGFYQLPRDVRGNVSWCEVVASDSLAVLSIYHRERAWTVMGYHQCHGPRDHPGVQERRPALQAKTRLLDLETLIDSLSHARQ